MRIIEGEAVSEGKSAEVAGYVEGVTCANH
jgi:hypothetical protein